MNTKFLRIWFCPFCFTDSVHLSWRGLQQSDPVEEIRHEGNPTFYTKQLRCFRNNIIVIFCLHLNGDLQKKKKKTKYQC